MKVLHKGLLIVAVPLLLEIAVLVFFGILLANTERTHRIEAQNRFLAEASSRVVFSQLNSVLALLRTWQQRDLSKKAGIEKEFHKIATLQIAIKRTDTEIAKTRKSKRIFLESSNEAWKRLEEVNALAEDGFTIANFMKLQKIELGALKGLDRIRSQYLILYDELAAQLEKNEKQMSLLGQLQVIGAIATFVITNIVAVILWSYFRRSFIKPIQTIKGNIEAYSEGRSLSAPLNGDDEISRFDAAFHLMISQLEQASQRERALFENSSDIIGILDSDLRFQKMNFALTRITGFPRSEIIGKPVQSILTEDSGKELAGHLARSRSETSENQESELQIISDNGESITTVWSTVWIDSLQQWCIVARDVREEKKIAQQKEEFLKLIANDLQSPLQTITDKYDQLADGVYGELPEQAVSKARGAIKTLNRMVSLVSELVQLERINSEINPPVRAETQVKPIIESALNDLAALIAEKNLRVSIDCPQDLTVFADPQKLIRVLVNLLSNAIKFSSSGKAIVIRAFAENKEENAAISGEVERGDSQAKLQGASIKFEVHDEGPGMSPESAQKLFRAFSQLDQKHGQRGKGTGLGLVISQRLVEQHHGRIGVESTEGSGSTFWFSIPNSEMPILPTLSDEQEVKALQDPQLAKTSESSNSSRPNLSAISNFAGTLSLRQKAIVLIAVPIIFQIGFSLAMLSLSMQASSELAKQLREHRLVSGGMGLVTQFFSEVMSTAPQDERGNVTWTQNLDDLKRFPDKLRRFEKEAKNDEIVRLYASDFIRSIEEELPQIESQSIQKQNGRMAVALLRIQASVGQRMEKLLDAVELRNKLSPEALKRIREQQTNLIFAALFANIVAAALLAIFFGLDISRRVLILSENTERFSKGNALLPTLPGRDDLADIDKSFHSMSQKVEAARAKESAYLKGSSNLICAFDEDYRLTVVNSAMQTYSSIPAAEMLGKSLLQFVPSEEHEEFGSKLNTARSNSKPIQFESRFNSPNAGVCDLLWSLTWSPEQRSFFCVAHDISKKKDLDRMRREFVALISHDLRSPITTVSSGSILVINDVYGPISPESKTVLNEVVLLCGQIVDLVNDLLDLEKLSAKKMQLQLESVDFLTTVFSIAKEKQITDIRSELEGDTSILIDIERFSFALSSLINECMQAHFLDRTIVLSLLQKKRRAADFEGTDSYAPGSAADLSHAYENKTADAPRDEMNKSEGQTSYRCRIMLIFEGSTDTRCVDELLGRLSGKHTQESEVVVTGSRLKIPLSLRILEEHGAFVRARETRKQEKCNLTIEIDMPRYSARVAEQLTEVTR